MPQTFSGDLAPKQLSQVINHWSWTFGGNSLFTINLGQSAAPAVEARIRDEVGSYGRQPGRIGDGLKVLLAHVELSGLTTAEQAAVDALKLQLDHVEVIKRETTQSGALH